MADTIVASQSTTPGATGTTNQTQNLLTHIKGTADAMDRGDILGSAMGVTNVAMDIIGIAGDPMGAITSAGVGWVLNAVSFLREPFDVLLGNPSAITGSSQSWMTAANSLSNTAAQYRQKANTQTCNWTGRAGNGYRAASNNQANGLEALAKACKVVSSAIDQAGKAVAQARKVVLDLITEAVNKIIQICIEALASSWLSFGASIAMGIAQSVQKAVTTAQKTIKKIKDVIETLQKIIKTVQQIIQLVKQVKQLLDQIGGKASGQAPVKTAVMPVGWSPGDPYYQPNDVGTRPQSATTTHSERMPTIPTTNDVGTRAQSATTTHSERMPTVPTTNDVGTRAQSARTTHSERMPAVPNVRPDTTQPRQAGPTVAPMPGGRPRTPQVNPQPARPPGRVSQNGWPVNPPRSPHTIPGTNVRVTVADGPAGEVLMHVLGQVNARVEDIAMNSDRNERDDWGYADRNVRGSEAVSNHASGTAVDINATRHALGASGTFTQEQVAEIHRILAEVDNVVRWGGDYTGRLDEMHFEINASQEEVARVAERLRQAQEQLR